MFKRSRQSVTNIFATEETTLMSSATEEESPSVASDFPGTARFVVAQEALHHLERNLATFKKIFADFHIPTSDYRLLAGFDEDLIRGRLGFLNQIHVFIHSEPPDMPSFLSRLSPALEQFSAYLFTDKSTYRLPSALPDFQEIARIATHRAAHGLPSCFSTLSQGANMGGSLNVGGPSGQSSNGKGGSRRKGKEREDSDQFTPPDSSKEGSSDPGPEFPGPDSGNARDAEVSFRVISRLHQRTEPFQELQVNGVLKIKRIPESHDPFRFAICDTEFTELRTTSQPTPEKPTYHQFQLDVRIDAKERYTNITKLRPLSTPKYGPESKVSNVSKKAWNSVLSGTLSFVKPQATIGASASRTGERSTSTEKTINVSRIIQRDIGPVTSWAFHIADPFDQEVGQTLSPEKLPFAHFEFRGKTPVPPPQYLNVEISTYWSFLSPRGGSAWMSSASTPSFSNLCKIIKLDLPSDLQGSHIYDADILVWPKQPNLNPTMCTTEGELQGNVGNSVVAVVATVIDTDRIPSTP